MFKTGLQLFAEAVAGKKSFICTALQEKQKQKLQRILRLQQKMEERRVRMRSLRLPKTALSVHREQQRPKLLQQPYYPKEIS